MTAGCGHGQGQREMFLNQSPMAWDGTLHLLSVLKCHPEQNPIETLIRAKASRPECVFMLISVLVFPPHFKMEMLPSKLLNVNELGQKAPV